MPGLELTVLAVAAFGWAALAFLADVLEPPPRPPGARSPFSGVDFGIE